MRRLFAFVIAQCVLAFALWSAPSCHNIPSAETATKIVVECAKQQASSLTALIDTLRPLLSGKAPKIAEAFSIAKKAGKEIGGCALALVTQEILSNRGSPPDTDTGWNLANNLQRYRTEVIGDPKASFEVVIDGRTVRL